MNPYVYAKNNIMLAPLAGYTDLAFRKLCAKLGAGLTFTEMVSAKGLHYNSEHTKELLNVSEEEGKAGVQLFGSDPSIMADIAARLEQADGEHIALFDINMGCPAPKIVNNGEGSSLMKKPELAEEIVKKLKQQVSLPVTVKFRKGFDEENINAVDFAKRMEDAGADALSIHGRTRAQFYSGKADWDIIAEVKRSVNLHVNGNGDIFTPEDAKAMFEHTKCDGILIARGAMGNPFIFRMINEYFATGRYTQPTIAEKMELCKEQARLACKDKGEYIAIREMRKQACNYLKGIRNSAVYKERAVRAATLAEFCDLMDEITAENK